MPDPLATVLRIRRVTVDDARRALAAALRAEDAALRHAAECDAAIGREAAAALDLAADDAAVEAYAAWLPAGRARAQAARAAHEKAQSEVATARAGLTAARSAALAAEQHLERRTADQAAGTARREQAVLDETGRGRRR